MTIGNVAMDADDGVSLDDDDDDGMATGSAEVVICVEMVTGNETDGAAAGEEDGEVIMGTGVAKQTAEAASVGKAVTDGVATATGGLPTESAGRIGAAETFEGDLQISIAILEGEIDLTRVGIF